jgi:septum formation protein
MTHDTLYLCSASASRQQLLREALIPYRTLSHSACEKSVPTQGDFSAYIQRIATTKLAHTLLPSDADTTQKLFMLAADTMVRGVTTGEIFGKPHDRTDAIRIIEQIRTQEIEVLTGCALKVYTWQNNQWSCIDEREWTTGALIRFVIEKDEVDEYLAANPHALHAAGATTIEGSGAPYLASISGSYSGVMGLPLYELKQTLRSVGFQFKGSI